MFFEIGGEGGAGEEGEIVAENVFEGGEGPETFGSENKRERVGGARDGGEKGGCGGRGGSENDNFGGAEGGFEGKVGVFLGVIEGDEVVVCF